MENNAVKKVYQAARSKRLRRRAIALFSALVLLLTTNGFKLKADALEHLPVCGYEEHLHGETCLDEYGNIACGLEEHVHTDACYQERPYDDAADEAPEQALPEEEVVAISAVEDAAEALEDVDLETLESDESNEAAEDVALPETQETPAVDLNRASHALLGDILAQAGIDLDADEIEAAGESIVDDEQPRSIAVDRDAEGYVVTALRDFIDGDAVELVVLAKDGGVYLVNLKNGTAFVPEDEAVAESVDMPAEETETAEENEIETDVPADPGIAEDEAEDPLTIDTENEEAEEPQAVEPADEEAEEPQAIEPTDDGAEVPQTDEPTDDGAEAPEIVEPADDEAEAAQAVEPVDDETEEPQAVEPADVEQVELPAETEAIWVGDSDGDEDDALPVPYPAQEFEGHTATMTVRVTADEGAFPEGTAMSVSDVVDEATISDIADAVEGDNVSVNGVHAVDITFRDAEGVEIEPLKPISVVMTVNALAQAADAVVVHMDDAGNAEVLEQTEADDGSEIAFDAETFSVYAVVVTERYISADGASWSIQLSYNSEAGIPEGASLRVAEVEDPAYRDRAAEALGEDQSVKLARFFDISIISDGREIQPEGAVTVKVELDDAVEADAVKAVHFAENDVDLIDVREADGALSFDAESFSVYGIVYTVDFDYDGATHSIAGESEILLSALLEKLNIREDLTGSNAVFSDPELVALSPVLDEDIVRDWLLTNLKPFTSHETLTVTLSDGRGYVIDVTDAMAQTSGGITILNPAIDITLISGAEQEDGENWVWTAHESEVKGHGFTFRVDYSFSTYTTQKTRWEREQIEIRIPLHILKDRSGNWADSLEMSIPSAEQEQMLNDTHVFVYEVVENEGEPPYVRIFNRIPADPTQVGYFEVNYKTSEETFEYVDYDPARPNHDNPAWATLKVYDETVTYNAETGETTVMADRSAEPLLDIESKQIPVNIDTIAEITGAVKRAPLSPYQVSAWDSAWGEQPEGEGEYYYAQWTVECKITATQPYDFTLTEAFKPEAGEVVGYRLEDGSGNKAFTAMADDTATEKNLEINYGSGSRKYTVLTRIPKAQYDARLESDGSYIIDNEVTATVIPGDGVDDRSSKTAKAHYEVEKPRYTVLPAGFSGEKKGLTSRFDLSSFIKEENYTAIPNLRYQTWVEASTWPYTYAEAGASDAEKQDEQNHGSYGVAPVTVEINDNHLWLRYFDHAAWELDGGSGTQEAYTKNSAQLEAGDYRFTGLSIGYAFSDGKYKEHEGFTRVGQSDDAIETLAATPTAEGAETMRLGDLVLELYVNGDDAPVGGEARYSFITCQWTIDDALKTYIQSISGMNVRFTAQSDVTGYKLSNTNALYATRLEAVPTVSLLKGDIVNEVLGKLDPESPTVDLWNRADHRVRQGDVLRHAYSRDGMDRIVGDIRKSVINKRYTEPVNDVIGTRYLISWDVDMSETYAIDNTVTAVVQQSGVFYDLLPTGVEYLPGTIQVYGDDDREPLNKSEYRVELVSNYNGSGRVMMIVSIDAPADRYRMTYDTAITWDAILQQRGEGTNIVTLHNAVAYETGNEDIGKFDKSYLYAAQRTPDLSVHPSDQKLYDRVETDDKGTGKVIMTVKDCPVGTLVSGTLGLQKTVRATVNSHGYDKTAVTYPEGEYSYRLQFGPNAGSMAKDLILYDFMESYRAAGDSGEVKSLWFGTVKSVDTSLVEGMGAEPVVYYSTVPRETMVHWLDENGLNVQTLADLDARMGDLSFWTRAESNDLSGIAGVTAIAVDLRRGSEEVKVYENGEEVESEKQFVLHGGRTASVYVYLNAPAAADTVEHGDDDSFKAYNDVYLNHAITGEGKTFLENSAKVINQGQTEVTYRVVGELRLRKVDIETKHPIEGITFHLRGTSDYGTEVDETRKTTATGSLVFDGIEKGTYTLWEESGSKDYQIDGDTRLTVKINHQGVAEITGFEPLPDTEADPDAEMPKLTGTPSTIGDSAAVLWTITNKPRVWADFEFTKLGDVDGQDAPKVLAGATFRLSGVSDYDNEIELYATSDTLGRVGFENVEQGTYTLEEYVEADGYIHANRKFRVTVDGNKNVTMALDGVADADADNVAFTETRVSPDPDYPDYVETRWSVRDEVKHNLSLLKVDAVSNRVLAGAKFRLSGTSNYGTPVDMVAVSMDSGAVDFKGLEPGVYALQEIEAPEHHLLDDTLYTVTIERDGKITLSWNGNSIDNTAEDGKIIPAGSSYGDKADKQSPANRFFYKYYARFSMPNARVENGVITIRKTWWDENGKSLTQLKDTAGLPAPMIHAMTEVPVEPTRPARIDRDKWDKFFSAISDRSVIRTFANQPNKPDDLSDWMLVSESKDNFPKNIYLKLDADGTLYWYADTVEAYLPIDSRNLFNKSLSGLNFVSLVGENVSLRANYTQSLTSMFQNCTALTGVTFPPNFGTENVTNASGQGGMNALFYDCKKLKEVDLSGFDFGKVTSFNNMFLNCSALEKVTFPASADTSRVTDMGEMFHGCNNLRTIENLSALDTGNVTNMKQLFSGCKRLGKTGDGGLDLSAFDTSKVTNMYYMLEDVGGYWYETKVNGQPADTTSINVSGFNTLNVQNMEGMFNRCYGLKTIDVSGFVAPKCTTTYNMFRDCKLLESVDLSHFNGSSVTTTQFMFNTSPNLKSIDLSNWNSVKLTRMDYMFNGCERVTSIDLTGFRTDSVQQMNNTFNNCFALETLDLSSFDTSNVTTMKSMFYDARALRTLTLPDGFVTASVTGDGVENLFLNCYKLENLNVSGWDTSNVKSMYRMFLHCESLTGLDLSSFDTSNVTSMSYMFAFCNRLNSIDVTSFDTSRVTSMANMFNISHQSDAEALRKLDLSSFDTGNVTNMSAMFYGQCDLTTVYVSDRWTTDAVTDSASMFGNGGNNNTSKLMGGQGTTFDGAYRDKTYARIDGDGQPGYFTEKAAPTNTASASAPSAARAATSRAEVRTFSVSGVIAAEMPAAGMSAESSSALPNQSAEESETTIDAAEAPDAVEVTTVEKVTGGVTVVGEDDGTAFDKWVIDPTTGEWIYRFHVYDEPELDENGDPIPTVYYITEDEKLDGVEYLSPFTWFSQDEGLWYQQLEYRKDTTNEVEVKNKKSHNTETPKGGLTVTKVVDDPTGSTYVEGQKFDFTIDYVRSDGTSVSGEKFQLQAGETKQWSDLKPGSSYSVSETADARYTVSFDRQSGTIGNDGIVRVVATNTVVVPRTGALAISKTVTYAEGASEGDDPEFSFVVTLTPDVTDIFSGRLDDGTARPVQFVNGVARVSLRAGETLTISGLPENTAYSVTEDETENYKQTSAVNNEGTIIADENRTAFFTNEKQRDAQRGGFTLTKRLGEGTVLDDPNQKFAFTVELAGLKPFAAYAYAIGDSQREFKADRDGAARLLLSLGAGKTASFAKEITRLPVNATFRITEPACGYIASYTAVNADPAVGHVKESSGRNAAVQKPLSTYEETVEADEQTNVVFTNDEPLYSVSVRKLDALSREAIAGAKLALYSVVSETEAEGETQVETLTLSLKDEFTSTARAKLEKLRPGAYLLRELEPPEGYAPTGDIRFDIDANGSAAVWNITTEAVGDGRERVTERGESETETGSLHIEMLDEPYILTVRKVDADGKPVRQAYLEIDRISYIREGNETHEGAAEPVVSFVTDATGETVLSGRLSADTIYELRELSAPAGYGLAEAMRFKLVNTDGGTGLSIYENGAWSEPSDALTLTMVDNTEFFFQKEWTDAVGEHRLEWQDDIEVAIVRDVKDTGTGNVSADGDFSLIWTIHRDKAGGFTFTPADAAYAIVSTYMGDAMPENPDPQSSYAHTYGFKVSNLPKYGEGVEYIYYVMERGEVTGFQEPKYYFGGNKYEGRTQSGGTIVNSQLSVKLPSTGGPGTAAHTASGLALVLLALALLLRRRRRD